MVGIRPVPGPASCSLILAALVAACGPGPSAMPRPDLSAIVLDADSAPDGMRLDGTNDAASEVATRVVISGRDSLFSELEGLRAGRYSDFSDEDGVLLSLGLEFEAATTAGHAFDLFLDELESDAGYGFDAPTSERIGDEGKCTEGANPALGGLHERICLWRRGSVVLIAGGTLTWPDVYRVAHDMDGNVGPNP